MTDFHFVPAKSHRSEQFALLRMPRPRRDFASKAPSLLSSSTRITSPPTGGEPRYWPPDHSTANLMLKPYLTLALAFEFASSLGGLCVLLQGKVTCPL